MSKGIYEINQTQKVWFIDVNKVPVKVKLINEEIETELPEYATDGASAMDIRASKDVIIVGNGIYAVPTNISVEIPNGYEIQVRPRSGLALKSGITVLNAPGTIDSDYRGEIKVILHNTRTDNFLIKKGDRIAQIVLAKVEKMTLNKVSELSNTNRGDGGFGHTGKQ